MQNERRLLVCPSTLSRLLLRNYVTETVLAKAEVPPLNKVITALNSLLKTEIVFTLGCWARRKSQIQRQVENA